MDQKYLAYGGFALIAFVLVAGAFSYFSGNTAPTGNAVMASCSDSDGGENYKLQGTVVAYEIGNPMKYKDECKTEQTLIEYSCKNVKGEMHVVLEEVDCISVDSSRCVNGACQG